MSHFSLLIWQNSALPSSHQQHTLSSTYNIPRPLESNFSKFLPQTNSKVLYYIGQVVTATAKFSVPVFCVGSAASGPVCGSISWWWGLAQEASLLCDNQEIEVVAYRIFLYQPTDYPKIQFAQKNKEVNKQMDTEWYCFLFSRLCFRLNGLCPSYFQWFNQNVFFTHFCFVLKYIVNW